MQEFISKEQLHEFIEQEMSILTAELEIVETMINSLVDKMEKKSLKI